MTHESTPHRTDRTGRRSRRGSRLGLSGKLLVLTILFVMIAEVLIYVPSIANFRLNWLNDRLAAAHTAALVLDAAPSGMVPESLARQILDSVGARAVAMKMGTQRRLLAVSDMPPTIHHDIDMRDVSVVPRHRRCLRHAAVAPTTTSCAWSGPAPMGGDFLEIVMDEAPLRQAMLRFSLNILLLSLIISGITATLVYLALHYLLVRPMRRITANMMRVPRRSGESGARHRCVAAARTRSASPSASSPRCSATSPRCCSRRAISRRSASRCRRSTTTCATC